MIPAPPDPLHVFVFLRSRRHEADIGLSRSARAKPNREYDDPRGARNRAASPPSRPLERSGRALSPSPRHPAQPCRRAAFMLGLLAFQAGRPGASGFDSTSHRESRGIALPHRQSRQCSGRSRAAFDGASDHCVSPRAQNRSEKYRWMLTITWGIALQNQGHLDEAIGSPASRRASRSGQISGPGSQ